VGTFIGDSWKEWNRTLPRHVRSFFRGEEGSIAGFCRPLIGSPSLYATTRREAEKVSTS